MCGGMHRRGGFRRAFFARGGQPEAGLQRRTPLPFAAGTAPEPPAKVSLADRHKINDKFPFRANAGPELD